MAKNVKKTSASIAQLASDTLRNPNSSETAKKLAGSALSQVNKGAQTGEKMETVASEVLRSKKYSNNTKDLAASILSQSNKER